MRRVFILYVSSIGFHGKTLNGGDQPRDCSPWCWPNGALNRETRMLEDWVAFVSSYLAWQNRSVNCLCSITSIPPNSKRLVRPASQIVSSTVFFTYAAIAFVLSSVHPRTLSYRALGLIKLQVNARSEPPRAALKVSSSLLVNSCR